MSGAVRSDCGARRRLLARLQFLGGLAMAIHSVRDFVLLALSGAFGGYTYWTFSTSLRALRERARARRR